MRYWKFKCFVDIHGNNVIRNWLDDQPIAVQSKIDATIRNLEALNPMRSRHVKPLKGKRNKGLLELRVFVNKVQYRPIGYYGPKNRQFTILVGAIEKGGKFVPKKACDIALKHKDIVDKDNSRACDYEY